MIFVLLGALHSPTAGSLLITVHLTWSPRHYTGQSYGIAMMFLRRRAVDISPAAKKWIYASFDFFDLSLFSSCQQHTAPAHRPDEGSMFNRIKQEIGGVMPARGHANAGFFGHWTWMALDAPL